MGEIVIRCPCGQSMRAPKEALGKLGRCVACGRPIRVQASNPVIGMANAFESDSGIERQLRSLTDVPAKFVPTPEKKSVSDYAGPSDSMQRLHNLWGENQTAPGSQTARPATAPPAVPVPQSAVEPRCARCGRAFRGDWDRYTRDEGVLCNICARQLPPERTPWDAPIDRGTVPPPSNDELRELARLTNRREKPPRDPNKYRGLPTFLAISAVVMLLVWILPVERWVGSFMISLAAAEAPEQGSAGYYAAIAFRLIGAFLANFIALYLALSQADKLPNESLSMNCVNIGLIVLLLWGIGVTGSLVAPVMLTASFIAIILQIYIVWNTYDLHFADMLFYFVIRILCSVILALLTPFSVRFIAWLSATI